MIGSFLMIDVKKGSEAVVVSTMLKSVRLRSIVLAWRRSPQIRGIWKHSSFMVCQYVPNDNRLTMNREHAVIGNRKVLKQMRIDSASLSATKVANHNEDIKSVVDRLENGRMIANFLKLRMDAIDEPSIFMRAMSKCQILGHHSAVCEIFDLMLTNSCVAPTVVEFTALLKSYRSQCLDCKAESTWNVMTSQYKIIPNEAAYSEMISIYAKAHRKEAANTLFSEYLDAVHNGKLSVNEVVFGSMLNAHSRCGDIRGMRNILELMIENALKVSAVHIPDIMRTHHAARQHRESLNVFAQWIEEGNKPSMPMIHLKCCALYHLIRTEARTIEERRVLYDDLVETIYGETAYYGLCVDPMLAETQLNGAIFLFHDHDPWRIVDVFEDLKSRGLIGYETSISNVVDLHAFQLYSAQFLIRYIIGVKLKGFEGVGEDGLVIILGKGNHGEGEGNRKGRLRNFVMEEMLSWYPPVQARVCEENTGRLCVDGKELRPYLENEMNYARRLLTEASNDWFYEDPRLGVTDSR